jgi:hypothetical protein
VGESVGIWRSLRLALADAWGIATYRRQEMAERLNVTLTVKVVDAKDGSDFMDGSLTYSDVPYDQLVMMEQSIMATMGAWGQAAVEAKKGKK